MFDRDASPPAAGAVFCVAAGVVVNGDGVKRARGLKHAIGRWAASLRGPGWEWACLGLCLLACVAKIAVEAGASRNFLDVFLIGAAAAGVAAVALRARRRYLDGWRLVLLLAALHSLPAVYSRIGGDGYEYYVLARSLVFDRDLDLDDDFAGFDIQPLRTGEGRAISRMPIGLPLLWTPALLATRLGLAVSPTTLTDDGFGPPFQAAATLTTYLLAILSLVLIERLLRRHYSPPVALVCVLALWYATPLYFYSVANPSMSHGASAALVAALVTAWLAARERGTPRAWLLVGLAGGLASLTRIQDAVLLLPPLLDLGLQRRSSADRLRSAAALLSGPLVAAMVQAVAWRIIYGGALGKASQGFMSGASLPIVEMLFSARHGLFTWTPVYALSACGLLLLIAHRPRLAVLFWIGFALSVVVNSGMVDWWGRDSFGQRRFLGLTPIFGFGLAEVVAFLRKRPLVLVCALLAGLAGWNMQFSYIYNSEMVAGKGEAVSLEGLTKAQLEVTARALTRASWLPRPVWVILYDNLRGAWLDEGPRPLGRRLMMGDDATGFPIVGHGWSAAKREEGTTLRFTTGPRAWLRIPILTPGDFAVSLRVRSTLPETPVRLKLAVNDSAIGEATLSSTWAEYRFDLPAHLLRSGVNDFALSCSPTPMDVIPDFRGRNSAMALEWIELARRERQPRY